jgi:hypothetical protein
MEFVTPEGLHLDGRYPMEVVFFLQYYTNNFNISILINIKLFDFLV